MQYNGPVKPILLTSNGAAVDIALGYVPGRIEIINRTSLAKLVWTNMVDAGKAYKEVAAGTRTLEASDGITIISNQEGKVDGFTLGAMADINDTNAEVLEINVMRATNDTPEVLP